MDEIWKDIKGYDGYYQVSNLGNIRSYHNGRWGKRKTPKILKPFPHRQGYLMIDLRDRTPLVHRLVAKAFIPIIKGKNYVNHKNGINNDNRSVNLEWCTRSENCTHATKLGLKNGEKNGNSKINYQIAYNIRQDRKNGMTQVDLSEKYDVSRRNIRAILDRKTWKHTKTQKQTEVSYRNP